MRSAIGQAPVTLSIREAEYGDYDIEPEYGYHWAGEWTFYVVLPPRILTLPRRERREDAVAPTTVETSAVARAWT